MKNLFCRTSVVCCCLLFLLAGGCRPDDGRRDIRDFYFPLKSLTDGLVYEYRPLRYDSLTPVYWYYRSLLLEEGIFLTGTYYEYDLTPQQFIREEMVSNGMLLEDIFLYETDSTGRQQQVAVEVLAGNAFPFAVSDSSGIFLYKVRWQPPSDPGATITLIKNRRFLGDTTLTIGEQKYDCIAFEVRELLEREENGYLEKEFSGLELYAKGVGLVYYKKDIADDLTLEYQLARRYPMTELEDQFRQQLEAQD